MKLRINKLMLQNFKGIKSLEIDAGGDNLTIYGDNATGKTTVFDAFMWLLFNKDSLGRSDFGIKTQDENGNVLHNLEHSVECEMLVDAGVLTLKKIYAEKWTKKRGSAEAEFSGHETKYFINEVPSTKKEYETRIANTIDESFFKTLTNPLYFNEHLKWQDRRAILLSLCEDITDLEIIGSTPEFAPLAELLQGRTIQEYKKIVSGKQSAINERLKAIPQRIAEANLAIPENIAEVDESEKAIIEQKIADLNNEIASIKSGAGVTGIDLDLQALRKRKEEFETAKCDVSALETELNNVKSKLSNANTEMKTCYQQIYNAETIIKEFEEKADMYRKKWYEVNEKQYTDNGICPTCGQAIPEEQIKAAKAKFNTERAKELEKITEQGKQAKAEAETRQKMRLELVEKVKAVEPKIEEYTSEIDRIMREIENKKAEFKKETAKVIDEINSNIAELEKKAQNGTEDIQVKIYPIQEQINTERAKLAEIDKAIAGRDLVERQKQRIAELETEEKNLAKEYAELEKVDFLIDKFIRHKIGILSDKINEHFKYAKFKLFDVQINGGIAECCETTFNGVEYSDLNNASRINVGLDIINTLCDINGKTAPIFIDNAESVTNILATKSQQIKLIVSGTDKSLRIEKE